MAEAVVDNPPAKTGAPAAKRPLLGMSFLENIAQMPMLRQIGLMVGLAASVAIGFAVVLWSQQPDYRPLYGSLSGMDTKQVMDTLAAADIPYNVEPNSGALLVKADDLSRARLKLAAAGVAPSDGNVGFELLDKEQGLGTSQFMEAIRYRRSLEGELARTVSSLNNVKGARVHLAIPKSSVFVRDERKPSASVLVELYPGRALEAGQVMAIVNLVATSVPELDKSQVTVVDQKATCCPNRSRTPRSPRPASSSTTAAGWKACSPSVCTTSCSQCWATTATRPKCRRTWTSVRWSPPPSSSTQTSQRCAASNPSMSNAPAAKARKVCPVH